MSPLLLLTQVVNQLQSIDESCLRVLICSVKYRMSGAKRLDNVAPIIHVTKSRERPKNSTLDDDTEDLLDAHEVFDHIRDINDPEHPYTLEQLNVVDEELIKVISEGP